VVVFVAAGLGHVLFAVDDVSDRCRSIRGRLRERSPACCLANNLADGWHVEVLRGQPIRRGNRSDGATDHAMLKMAMNPPSF
jgi:hypothetical protein